MPKIRAGPSGHSADAGSGADAAFAGVFPNGELLAEPRWLFRREMSQDFENWTIWRI